MTPKQLNTIGELMYGKPWKAALAADIKSNRRQVERWSIGEYTAPPWVVDEIKRLAVYYSGLQDQRREKINKILKEME